MSKHDQPLPDEIREEVPKESKDNFKPYKGWTSSTSVEEMSATERKAFRMLPKGEQLAYQAKIDAENAAATAYMQAEIDARRLTHAFVESDVSRTLRELSENIAADERLEMRLAAERLALGEQREFLIRTLNELSVILKDVAREEDLDSIPGWGIAAFELLPYVSMASAFFGKEIATRRDPGTGEVTGLRLKDLTSAERAIHATIGEMAFSKKITMTIMKVVKKVLARSFKSSVGHVAGTVKKALT